MTNFTLRVFDPSTDKTFTTVTGLADRSAAWDAADKFLREDSRWSSDEAVHRNAAGGRNDGPLASIIDLRLNPENGTRTPVSVRISED